jgi:hypothetical protein
MNHLLDNSILGFYNFNLNYVMDFIESYARKFCKEVKAAGECAFASMVNYLSMCFTVLDFIA